MSRAHPSVDDFYAPVQRVALFTLAGGGGPFLAETDDPNLLRRHAGGDHGLAHGIGAALAQRDVVLAAAALIGVPFQLGDDARIAGQGAGVGRDDRLAFRWDFGTVEAEVNNAIRRNGATAGGRLTGGLLAAGLAARDSAS